MALVLNKFYLFDAKIETRKGDCWPVKADLWGIANASGTFNMILEVNGHSVDQGSLQLIDESVDLLPAHSHLSTGRVPL